MKPNIWIYGALAVSTLFLISAFVCLSFDELDEARQSAMWAFAGAIAALIYTLWDDL